MMALCTFPMPIDRRLAHSIARLDMLGLQPQHSCQGDDNGIDAYLSLTINNASAVFATDAKRAGFEIDSEPLKRKENPKFVIRNKRGYGNLVEWIDNWTSERCALPQDTSFEPFPLQNSKHDVVLVPIEHDLDEQVILALERAFQIGMQPLYFPNLNGSGHYMFQTELTYPERSLVNRTSLKNFTYGKYVHLVSYKIMPNRAIGDSALLQIMQDRTIIADSPIVRSSLELAHA